MPQAIHQLVEPAARARVGLRLGRIGVHDQIQPALEVVEHRHFFRQQQEGVGRAELIGLALAVEIGEARFDPADALETEITDQAAGEHRQFRQARHLVLRAQAVDFGQRVGELARFHRFAVFAHGEGVAAELEGAARRQADDGIAAPGFAAFHRFEQIGVRAVGQFQIDRQRRVEVGQHLAHHGNAVVAGGGELPEGFLVDHAGVTQGGGRASMPGRGRPELGRGRAGDHLRVARRTQTQPAGQAFGAEAAGFDRARRRD